MRRQMFSLLLLVVCAPPVRADSTHGISPLSRRVDTVVRGVRLSLMAPRGTYPRNVLAEVRVSVRNISRHPVYLELTRCPYGNLSASVFSAAGQEVYPPALQDGLTPTCPRPRGTITIRPGHGVTRTVYVILRGDHLRAVALLARDRAGIQVDYVQGKPLTVTLVPGQPPQVTLNTSPQVSADIQPTAPPRGPLLYTWWTACTTPSGIDKTGTFGWDMTAATRLVPTDPKPGCLDEWHALAGWVGEPVASIDYVRSPQTDIPRRYERIR